MSRARSSCSNRAPTTTTALCAPRTSAPRASSPRVSAAKERAVVFLRVASDRIRGTRVSGPVDEAARIDQGVAPMESLTMLAVGWVLYRVNRVYVRVSREEQHWEAHRLARELFGRQNVAAAP